MDWCIETNAPQAVAIGADEVAAYFRRHANVLVDDEVRAEVWNTILAVASSAELVWARVDWDGDAPELSVRALAPDVWPQGSLNGAEFTPVRPGVVVANRAAVELAAAAHVGTGLEIRRRFELTREPEADLDASPALLQPSPADLTRESFLAAVALSSALPDAPNDPAARAAQAGAELSVAALAAYLRRTGRARPRTASEAAAAFLELQSSAGANFYLLEADDDHAVLGNTRCPFGSGVTAAPMMCRCTSAVLGRLGAEAGREAWVTMPERIALGDPECRAVLDLGPSQPSPISHRYVDPPAGLGASPGRSDLQRQDGDPRVVLSLLLPRDVASVPVVRHLCEQVVGALGATPESIGDLTVALTEACSNVIRHALSSDDFRVDVELGGESCELVVSYRDDGFDPDAVGVQPADADSETGRGLMLMRALVDELDFTFDPGRTSVRMVKRLDFSEERPIQQLLRPKRDT
ncbi:MAG: hypothetical protein NVS3B21_17890 [Acidimicrobiales bacterium]